MNFACVFELLSQLTKVLLEEVPAFFESWDPFFDFLVKDVF